MSGWRKATITGTEVAGPNLQLIRVEVPSAVAVAFHTPGQFVRVKVGEFDSPFAIASAPGGTQFEFFVRTNGDVAKLWSALPAGSEVEVGLPDGPGFPLERAHGHSLLLVGTGTGWAPLRSVLLAVRSRRADFRNVHGIYGALTPEHVVFDEEFSALKPEGLEVRVTVTEPMSTWTGPVGRVQALLPTNGLDATFAFLCGQPEMTAEVTRLLVSRGLPADRVFLNF
ncbi:MAG: NAD-binding oxidoreductase [Archangium sp.]